MLILLSSFLSSQCDIIKCVQEFHRQHTATALEYQHKGNACLCFLNPSFCKGKKCPQLHNRPQQPFDFTTMFMYQMEDWRSWLRSWTVGKWCTLSAGSRIQIPACLNMSSSTGLVLHSPLPYIDLSSLLWPFLTRIILCVSDWRGSEGCQERNMCKSCPLHGEFPEGNAALVSKSF